MSTTNILQPIMQAGFAGMCAALLGIVVWMVEKTDCRFNEMLKAQQETNQVIERNTAAIAALGELVAHNQHP